MAIATQHHFQMDDSDEEFEAAAEEERFSGKTALIVLIEATQKMFQGWEDNEQTPFMAAVKCCESIWRSKVVSNTQDIVSIIFFGTEHAHNSAGFPNIFEFQELSKVNLEMIKTLIEMRKSNDLSGFQENIGSSDDYNFKDLFWLIKMNLDKAKTQTFLKKIMIFTTEDNPHGDNPNLQTDAVNKFKDLGKLELNVVSFKEKFDFGKFYSKVEEEKDESIVSYSKDLTALQQVVRMKQRLKRPLSRSTLELTPEVKLGVGIYSFVRQAKPPKHVSINMRNNQIVERKVNVFRSDSGMPVLKSEERKMVQVQGEVAVFTTQEVKEIKCAQNPGLKLLGFLRLCDFDFSLWYRSPGYFLYPDEKKISGSKDVFATLLQRCAFLERAPIVRYVLSRGKTPKVGLLIPSLPKGESKHVFPQGFHLFPIPFSDEIRNHDLETANKASPELLELVKTMVKKLTFKKYNVLEVQNPALQSFWQILEEEALEEKVDDDFYDYTEQNLELMKERLKDLPHDINDEVERTSGGFSIAKSAALVKKPKFTVDIAMEARNGRLNSCTVAQLKEFLDSRGIVTSRLNLRKADYVELVMKALDGEVD